MHMGNPQLCKDFELSVFFIVHGNLSFQQLLYYCSMEHIIFEGPKKDDDIPVLQFPIPDIPQEEIVVFEIQIKSCRLVRVDVVS